LEVVSKSHYLGRATSAWSSSAAYAENFHGGGFFQWHMMVIFIWCALFVASHFDGIFMFPNQCFGKICWHNRHTFLHALPLFYVITLNINYQRSKLEYRRKINSTLRHSSS